MPSNSQYPGETVLPLPAEGFGSYAWWQEAITAAEELRKQKIEEPGKKNVQAYCGETAKKDDDLPVNVDFYNTEQKKSQLLFRQPDVVLTALQPGLEDAVTIFQPVMNHYLGPTKTHALAMVDECLFDLLCPAGLMACKVGYEATEAGTVEVPTGELQPDPTFAPPVMPGAVLGLSDPPPPPLVPVLATVPNIIAERYFLERVSPAKSLIPADFHGSDYDRSSWLGFEFVEDLAIAKAKGWVPPDFKGSGEDTHKLVENPKQASPREIVVGKEIWYYANRFDPKEKNPHKMRQLIFIDGVSDKKPAVHRDSPYQRFGPNGKMVSGMKGNPIHIGTIRYVSDSAYPPSDCTISRRTVDALSHGHGQMMAQRDRALPVRWFDRNRVDPEDVQRLKKADIQGMVPVDGNGNEIIGEVSRANWPRENFTFDQVLQTSIDRLWALGSNQGAVTEETVRSATELSLIQSAVNNRLDYERNKVLAWYVRAAAKLGALIQLFADQEDYIEIQGEHGAKRLAAWDKTRIQGEFAYTAKPDSAIRLDAAQDRKQWLDWTNFTAKSPVVNQVENMRLGAPKFGYDPARVIQVPEPPPPPPPSISFRFSGPDLALPEVRMILEQNGIKLGPPSPEAVEMMIDQQMKNLPHGGPADKPDVLSKRSGDETGNLSGAGTVPSQAAVE